MFHMTHSSCNAPPAPPPTQPKQKYLTLDHNILALAVHPTERIVAVGESSGVVSLWAWREEQAVQDEQVKREKEEEGNRKEEPFVRKWRTARHKGSCRALEFSADGKTLYSAGAEGLVKAADVQTGRVLWKCWIPTIGGAASDDSDGGRDSNSNNSPTCMLEVNPEHLLVGTDGARVYLFDLRKRKGNNEISIRKWRFDTLSSTSDYISSLTALPPSSNSTSKYCYHFIAIGAEYLFHLDSRKPGKVLHQSESQDDEVLCCAFISNWSEGKKGFSKAEDKRGKVVTGMVNGILGVWDREAKFAHVGQKPWETHAQRVNTNTPSFFSIVASSVGGKSVSKKQKKKMEKMDEMEDSVDSIVCLPDGFKPVVNTVGGKEWAKKRRGDYFGFVADCYLAVGTGTGKVKVVRTGGNPGVVGVYDHFPSRKGTQDANDEEKEGHEGAVRGGGKEGMEPVLCLGYSVAGECIVSGAGNILTLTFPDQAAAADPGGGVPVSGDSDESDEGQSSESSDNDSDDSEKEVKGKKRKRKGKPKGPPPRKNVVKFSGMD